MAVTDLRINTANWNSLRSMWLNTWLRILLVIQKNDLIFCHYVISCMSILLQFFPSRLGESGHVSSPASQSESTCGSPGEQGGGSGGGGHNGHPPEGQPAIQQQQGGLVGNGPSSGSLVSRTMTSSTPTYSSSPASWTLATPSDNSLGNQDNFECNNIQNVLPIVDQDWLKTVLFSHLY